jgi:hypothetical protein
LKKQRAKKFRDKSEAIKAPARRDLSRCTAAEGKGFTLFGQISENPNLGKQTQYRKMPCDANKPANRLDVF